jgi:hypothetical protein
MAGSLFPPAPAACYLLSCCLLPCCLLPCCCFLPTHHLQFFTMDCRGCGNSQAEKMGVDESRLGGI